MVKTYQKQQAIPSINQDIVYLFVHDKILPCKIQGKKIEIDR